MAHTSLDGGVIHLHCDMLDGGVIYLHYDVEPSVSVSE
jgi:hypothetical protein